MYTSNTFKLITIELILTKGRKANILIQTSKTFKKSYSVLSRILTLGQILNPNKLKSCCKNDAKRRIAKLKLRTPATKLSLGRQDKKRENRGPKITNKTKIKTKKNPLLFATQTTNQFQRLSYCTGIVQSLQSNSMLPQ